MFRKVMCGVVAAACLTVPALANQGTSKLRVPVTEFDLPNGLHVILHEDHTIPTVSTNIWYHVGSGRESAGHSGFAHLFEHLMFCGSGHVAKGQFDELLEKVGGTNNASTSEDRTNYYTTVPANALPLVLFLESDRMGYLIQNLRGDLVDEQRDVVRNEYRQRYLNTPYGKSYLAMPSYMYPEGHPYSWPVIGHEEELMKFNNTDVINFFRKYYVPNNASLAICGDFKTDEVRKMVEYWFSDIPRGEDLKPLNVAPVQLDSVVKKEIIDKVELPSRTICWHTPKEFTPDDIALDIAGLILADGKESRLQKRMIVKEQLAQLVNATQMSQSLGSIFSIDFMPRPGHTLDELQSVVDEELRKLAQDPPSEEEMAVAVNGLKAAFYRTIEKNANVANYLNRYYLTVGKADYFEENLEEYMAVTPERVSEVVRRYLVPDKRLELTTIPEQTAKK